MSWNIGNIQIYIDVTEDGRMQLGITPGDNLLEKLFPIDIRKQDILPKHEWKRYERSVLAKREAWVRENIPAGKYIFELELSSEMLKLKS